MTTGLGFSGLGWLGQSLLAEIEHFPELAVAAVQDVDPGLAEEVGSSYKAPWIGTDFSAMLAQPNVDAVVICTTNALHASQAQAALAMDKHVLVQKPLALRSQDAAATVAAAERAGKLLLVDYTYRFLATTELLETSVRQLGPIRSIRGAFHNVYGPGKSWFFDRSQSGGGALMDLGVHLIDLALHLTQPSKTVLLEAVLGYQRGLGVEDSAVLECCLDDVALQVEVSWQSPREQTEIAVEVQCANGSAAWRNVDGSFFRFRSYRDQILLLDRETTLRRDTLGALARALRGLSVPRPDLRVYELLEQAYASAPL